MIVSTATVLAGTAATLTSCAGRLDEPAGCAAPSVVAPTASPAASPAASATGLTHGPAPRIGLVVDGVDAPPAGGAAYPLPRLPRWAHVAAGHPVRRRAARRRRPGLRGTTGLTLVTAEDTREVTPCPSGAGATDAARALAAWATSACAETGSTAPSTVHLRSADATVRTQVIATPTGTSGLLSVAGILDGRGVVTRVFEQGAFLTDLGDPPRAIPGVVGVAAVDEAHGTVAAAPSTTGSAVLDPETGDVRFRIARGRHFGDFSPDGSTALVLGTGRPRAPPSGSSTPRPAPSATGPPCRACVPTRSCGRTLATCWRRSGTIPRRGPAGRRRRPRRAGGR